MPKPTLVVACLSSEPGGDTAGCGQIRRIFKSENAQITREQIDPESFTPSDCPECGDRRFVALGYQDEYGDWRTYPR